jgi:hypothetical protein
MFHKGPSTLAFFAFVVPSAMAPSGETNPYIWDSNTNESLDDFEEDSHESDSNPNPKNQKKDSSLNKS